MDCREFRNNIVDYIEDRMDKTMRDNMTEHMGNCADCYEVYRKRFDINRDFSHVLAARNVSFASQRLDIMKHIDGRRYKRGILNRIGFHLKEYNIRYAACAMSLLLIFMSARFISNGTFTELTSRFTQNRAPEAQNHTVEGVPGVREEAIGEIIDSKLEAIIKNKEGEAALLSSKDKYAFYKFVKNNEDFDFIVAQKDDALKYLLSKFKVSSENGICEYVMAMACAEILGQDIKELDIAKGRQWYENYVLGKTDNNDNNNKDTIQQQAKYQVEITEGSKQEINPTRDGISNLVALARRKELVDILKKAIEGGPGVGPWRPIFASEEIMLFYDYAYMLAYNPTEKNKGVINILDYSKLNVGSYQGSSIAGFIPSPNGRFCLIGNYLGERDIKATASLYLLDINTGKMKVIGEEINLVHYLTAWSPSSQYLAIADISGKSIVVYDTKADKTVTIPFNHNKQMMKLYVSDKGNVLISGESTYFFENYKKAVPWNVEGDIIHYDDKGIVYYSEGNITRNQAVNTGFTLLKTIEQSYKLERVHKDQAIFTDGTKTLVYNISNNSVNTYNFRPFEGQISPDGKRLLFNPRVPLTLDDAEGKTTVIDIKDAFGEYDWKNNNTIVSLIHDRHQEDKTWQVRIVEINVDTMKGKVVFQP